MLRDPADARSFARPRLVVSRCLDLEPCRYNGAVVPTPLVRRLASAVDLVPVCPEVEIGLGVPRDPIRLVRRVGTTALVQPATGLDLTRSMADFAARFLDGLTEVDGFLLKARSPSCGVHGVKVFPTAASETPGTREAGMFARAVLARFPDHPAEHEGRLTNPRLLDHFLTRLFALAELRRSLEESTLDALVALHDRYRRARRTWPAAHDAALDAIVVRALAARDASPADWREYAAAFRAALAPAPSAGAHAAVMGEIARPLGGEPAALIASYAVGTTPRWVILQRLCAWTRERDRSFVADAYLAPYPDELVGGG
jgi:uncharacterized protein YbbK (DUF523 family)/uncharacterized protein YbgA (DUF1722 family)